ncbi:acylphosphatase [Candidatus Woesearchaeota archaeon CG_4_10_14_0_8_um_filter_47_5]|nr:MAG: acylphosphatase [Candidatus Woesearchaeota archaeon CG_4_10_14_0_8_um_filter_47_5]
MKELHLIISGRVQGVFYRHHARKKAAELGVTGFVRNLPDGTVEVVAQGGKMQLTELMMWCRSGPDWAQVDDMKVEWRDVAAREFSGFEIR